MSLRDESPFRVKLRDIPEEGLRRDIDLADAWAEQTLAGTEASVPAGRLAARVSLFRSRHDVVARGRLAGELQVPCRRCLGPARVAVDATFGVTFVPAGEEPSAASEELAPEAADLATYEGDEIDLEEAVRDEVLTALPMAAACDDACKGLCARCGKNLNEGPCECPPEAPDDRWAALKDVKL